MNEVVLIGNLVADPEMSEAAGPQNRCTFRIAVNRDYLNKETGKRDADYLRVVTWGGLADVCMRHLQKGKKVAVKGTLKGRSIPREDGTSFYTTEVKADTVDFLTPKEQTAMRDFSEICTDFVKMNGENPLWTTERLKELIYGERNDREERHYPQIDAEDPTLPF